ncbi:hypothetical protein [Rhodococcus sp. BS-15]|uniref:hypothetical protein n=1 Tax=Rhodococcus sp. BS-15 TaxID=1304954 RepID=UPI000FFC6BF6|nr:hypothetical protein [Rhodococcus sp. BS-15]
MAFVVIQEGGSSTEFYVSAWGSVDEAEAHRISCRNDGAYRTTEPVEMPDGTDWDALENVVQSLATLD